MIPDAIEPYRGWKILKLGTEWLSSPQQATRWPPGQRLEASCTANHGFRFVLSVPGEPLPEGTILYQTIAQPNTSLHLVLPLLPLEINYYFDAATVPGSKLSLIREQQPIVAQHCTCGIYVLDDPYHCQGYADHWKTNVLAEVALWGRVIKAERGARGQYAYPQKLIGLSYYEQMISEMAARYQIPYETVWSDSDPKLQQLFYRDP